MHQIGVGVLGPVYRAYNPARDNLFAVKALHIDVTPEQAQTLAALLGLLADAGPFHAGVVAAAAAGVEDGVPFLAQEYVAAESLDVAMRHYAPIAIGTALPLIRQLAEAVDAAHAHGVVHGGLHLRDVFFTPGGARMTGFGVVAAIEKVGFSGPLRRPYAAPEMVAGQPWGPEADRYSLAAVAYELLTGKRAAGTVEQVAARLGKVRKVENLGAMQDVFATALAEKPERRYPNAFRFASELHAAAGVEVDDPPAPPPTVAPATSGQPARTAARDESGASDAPAGALDAVTNVDTKAAKAETDAGERQDELPLVAPEQPAIGSAAGTADSSGAASARSDANLLHGSGSGGWSSDPGRADRFDEPDEIEDDFDRRDSFDEPDRRSAPEAFTAVAAPPVGEEHAQRQSWMSGSAPAIAVLLCIGAVAAYFVGFRLAGGYAPRGDERAADVEVPGPGAGLDAVGGDAGGSPAGELRDPATMLPEADAPPPVEFAEPASAPPVTSRPVISPPVIQPPVEPLPPPVEPLPPPPAPAAARASEDRSPEAAPDAPAQAAGWLLVRTTPPGAAVTVNDEDRGRTPLSIRDLPLGAYRVEVRRSGFQSQEREMTLSSADPIAAVEIDLLPETPPSAAPAAGSIVVESRPTGATVILDGRVVGATPAVVADVAEGTYQVRIEHDGYRPWVADVNVEASDQVRVAASLDHLPGR